MTANGGPNPNVRARMNQLSGSCHSAAISLVVIVFLVGLAIGQGPTCGSGCALPAFSRYRLLKRSLKGRALKARACNGTTPCRGRPALGRFLFEGAKATQLSLRKSSP